MDSDVLRESRAEAANPRRGYIDGYGLRIGRRATLVPDPGSRALTHDELERLYSAPGLEDYRAEAVLARTLEGEALPALCFNLRQAPRSGEANADYAERLRAVLRRLDLPAEYVRRSTWSP